MPSAQGEKCCTCLPVALLRVCISQTYARHSGAHSWVMRVCCEYLIWSTLDVTVVE